MNFKQFLNEDMDEQIKEGENLYRELKERPEFRMGSWAGFKMRLRSFRGLPPAKAGDNPDATKAEQYAFSRLNGWTKEEAKKKIFNPVLDVETKRLGKK